MQFRLLGLVLLVLFATSVSLVQTASGQIMISQYAYDTRGTNNNQNDTEDDIQGVELWNVSGSTIDFSNQTLEIVQWEGKNNDNVVGTVTVNSGELAAGEVYVLAEDEAPGSAWSNQGIPVDKFVDFNFTPDGGGALEVKLGGTTTDVFGKINNNNGPWSGTDSTGVVISTQDWNMKTTVGTNSGDPDGWTDPTTTADGASSNGRFKGVDASPLDNNSNDGGTSETDLDHFGVPPPTGTDKDSYASNPGTQVSAKTISSLDDSESEAVSVIKFDLYDTGNSDGQPTNVTNLRLKPGSNNTADLADHIQGVTVRDVTNDNSVSTGTATITSSAIDIPVNSGDANNLEVPDGGNLTVEVSVYLNTSNIVDGATLELLVDADNNGFGATLSGSQFDSDFNNGANNTEGDIVSEQHTIDVTSTTLNFSNVPNEVDLNREFSLTVSATDANGNVDLDENGLNGDDEVTLSLNSGSGTLSSSSGLTQNLTEGSYKWTDLVYDTVEDITIDAGNAEVSNATSPTITVADLKPAWINEVNSQGGTTFIELMGETRSNSETFTIEFYDSNGNGPDATETVTTDFSTNTVDGYGFAEVTGVGGNFSSFPFGLILKDSGGNELFRFGFGASSESFTAGNTGITFTNRSERDGTSESTGFLTAGPPGDDVGTGGVDRAAGDLTVTQGARNEYDFQVEGSGAGWRMMAPPVTDYSVGNLANENLVQGVTGSYPDAGVNLYLEYADKDGSGDEGWIPASSTGDALPAGEGFIWYLFDTNSPEESETLPFTIKVTQFTNGGVPIGDLARGEIAKNDTFFVGGNPYPNDYTVSGVDLSTQGFKENVQVWDSDVGSYKAVGPDAGQQELSPWQGFVAERDKFSSGTTTLTFSNSAQQSLSADDATFYSTEPVAEGGLGKSHSSLSRIGFQLEGRDEEGNRLSTDQAAALLFTDQAEEGEDPHDLTKLDPNTVPSATISFESTHRPDTTTLRAISAYPKSGLGHGYTIPAVFEVSDADQFDEFVLSWPDTKNIPDYWTLTLRDTEADTTINLHEATEYSFSARDTVKRSKEATSQQNDVQASPLPHSKRADAGSRFQIHVESDGASIPAEFGNLETSVEGRSVVLSWTTENEIHNDGFSIDHKFADGRSSLSEESWSEVAFVEVGELSSKKQQYSYRVGDDELEYGTHAFRLRGISEDGEMSYSQTVKAEVLPEGGRMVSAPYPNPSQSQATMDLLVGESQTVQVEMYDVLGRRIRRLYEGKIPNGRVQKVQIETEDLPSGGYFVRVNGEEFTVTRRIMVVK